MSERKKHELVSGEKKRQWAMSDEAFEKLRKVAVNNGYPNVAAYVRVLAYKASGTPL